ncbi:MAG TPA: hypothetical protein VFF65_02120 [Phycisphaerales bacterium]|nr:hypothetical protein [Phycisphaerales bacterium]
MSTPVSLPLLDRVQIAAPCHARWEDMTGDERTRHCAECRLDVHNLSAMTRTEAEAFLRERLGGEGGRLCARIYRRADGTVLTADCPVGLAALRARARRGALRVAAALGLTSLVAAAAAAERGRVPSWMGCQPFAALASAMGRQPVPQPGNWVAGAMCPLPPPAQGSNP